MSTLIEKFRANPLRIEELKPIDFSGFKWFWGTYTRFGFDAAFPNISPLYGFLSSAVRGFKYRDCFLEVNEKDFPFKDKDGNYVGYDVIEGGKKDE